MSDLYRIGIVGLGVVGKGIQKLFGDSVTAIYDPNHGFGDKDLFTDVDLIVICVPTPESKDGSCDTSAVGSTLEWISDIGFDGVVLLKSTVPPTAIKKFLKDFPRIRLVFSPEYMGESKYFTPFWKYPDPQDMRSHTWQIFGGEKKDTSLCVDIFQRKMSVDTVFLQTTIMTASLAKYAENCFFATKVTFCNEFYDIAETFGVDYNELRECWLADTRINRNHTMVFKKDRGYGGRCYPKDMKAMIADAKKAGYSADLLKAVDKVNERIRTKNRS